MIFIFRDYFKGIQFRYLWLAIGVYMLLDIGDHILNGYQFSSAITALPNKWYIYLAMIISYTVASKIKQSNQRKKS